MEKEAQIRRVQYYEEIFDELKAAVDDVNRARKRLSLLRDKADELAAYYAGRQWKTDYEDDEAGLLPAGLKRGVLSQDGVYDLLEKFAEAEER